MFYGGLRGWPLAARVYLRLRRLKQRSVRWWRRGDRRYGFWWRLGNGAAAALILASVVIPVVQQLSNDNSYKLSADALKLVGTTDQTLTKQLTYDGQTSTYQFNKNAVKSDASNPLSSMQAQLGTASGTGKDKSLYALDVPTDVSKGVTYHDINSQTSFSLVPQFTASAGKEVSGHLVFPLSGGNQAIYTLKNNGLKEDIVVPKATEDTMTFSYHLNLPKTLEAKVIPGSDGAIGIYSGDPSLFGNITYGSDKDRAAVEKARENAAKTYLVFGLPAPVIKDTKGNEVGDARFALHGNQLTVIASGLGSAKGAVTIDPSVVVTSASDFLTGNNEDNIDFSTSGQVTRGGLTGGSVNTSGWTVSSTSLTQNLERFGSFVYNGRLCYLGGVDKATNTWNLQIYCSTINTTNGTLSGSWSTVGNLSNGDMACGSLAIVSNSIAIYNNTLYVIGGSCNGTKNLEYYATFKSTGILNSWIALPNLPVNNDSAGVAAYNGYIYMIGGGGTSGVAPYYNTVYYAAINADGTLGSWTLSPNNLLETIGMGKAIAYNSYLYLVAGANGSGFSNTVEFAKINSDGSVGTWQQTSAYATARYGQTVYAYNGYMYTVGGWGHNDTQYAQINANGTLGAWQTSSSYDISAGEGQRYVGGAAYNGYIYVMGGRNEASTNSSAAIQYAKIDPAGTTGSYGTTTSLSGTNNIVTDAGTIAYNGYLYIIGGYNGSSYITTTHYAPLGADGTIGTWNTTAALNTAAGDAGVAIYNGYMYVVGGETGTSGTYTSVVQYAAINSSGTLGTWNTTTALSNAQGNHHAAAYNGYLYVLNSNGGGTTTTVQYASINSVGTVNGWANTSSLNTARVYESLVAYGGYLYAVGGNSTSSVEYAAINSSNGTLGSWTATSSMSIARGGNDAFVASGYLCAVGGDTVNSGTETATAECASIKNDGSLNAWQSNTSMAGAVHRGQIAYYNGYVYSVSGKIGGSRVATSYYAAVNNGGSGAAGAVLTSSNNFTNGRGLLGAVAYKGYLYVLGGVDSSSVYYNDVQYAAINPDGTVGTWSLTASFINARGGLGAFASGGYMYILGGYDGTTYYNDVQYAPINSNGTLGAWHYTHSSTDDGTSFVAGFNTARYGLGAFAYNGYLYVLGGKDSAGYDSDTQYAPLNSNGTIGTWQASTSFTTGRRDFGVTAYGGFVYITSGDKGATTYLSDTQYAPLESNGEIGTWSTTSVLESTTAVLDTVAYNGYLYGIGGLFRVNFTIADINTTKYAPLSIIQRTGHYSNLIDLGGAVNVTGIVYNPVAQNATITYRAAGSNGVFGSSALASAVSGTGGCAGNLQNTRYVLLMVTLDDSYGLGSGGAFPDINGTNASVTDLTVNYSPVHPAPNIRLRSGQTLQQGNLSALDTCYP